MPGKQKQQGGGIMGLFGPYCYTLRPYQREAVDAAVSFLKGPAKHNAIEVLPTGCHAAGTEILMADGTVKAVETVQQGEAVMGPDGSPRKVLSLCRGREMMYRVTPRRGGKSFVVNENHVLSLVSTNEGKGLYPSQQKGGERSFITIGEWLKKSKSWRWLRKLHRSEELPLFGDRDLRIPPWILGVILGDGSTLFGNVCITTPDEEVIEGVKRFSESYGCAVRQSGKKNNRAVELHLVKKEDRHNRTVPSPILDAVRASGMSEKGAAEKYIPQNYKVASVTARLELLAGLLDTDGHYEKGGGYDLISKSPRLAADITFVARSLGLTVSESLEYKQCQTGAGGYYSRLHISGDIDKIPCRVQRKKASPRRQKKNNLVTGFTVEPMEEGSFYGFELDGDHLYLTADFFVHHNSGKSLIIANIVKELGEPVLIFQPSKEILEQNLSKLLSYGYHAGVYSASKGRTEISNITFATIGSVVGKAGLFENFRYIIVDECFPAGTQVDGRPIEEIRIGDTIRSLDHRTGQVELKPVVRLFKRLVNTDLVTIRLTDGSSFCCTDNHPIYVKNHGYVPAIMLSSLSINDVLQGGNDEQNEDIFLQGLRQGMPPEEPHQNQHLLQQGVCLGGHKQEVPSSEHCMLQMRQRDCNTGHSEKEFRENGKGLLLAGMRIDSEDGGIEEGRNGSEAGPRMEETGIYQDEGTQPHVDAGGEREDDRIVQGENLLFCEGWKRSDNEASNRFARGDRDEDRVCGYHIFDQDSLLRCAPCLQSRFGRSRDEASRGSGRRITQQSPPKVARCKEDGSIEFLGVDSVEVHKRGSRTEFDRLCPNHYVYNLEVEDNHNYFVNNVLVHNCHLVNAKEGMYKTFLDALMEKNAKVLGLTATPYRLASNSYGPELRFLTRTRPRMFREMIYHVQNRQLFDNGYLARLEYVTHNGFDRAKLQVNSTGADFTDESVQTCLWASNLPVRLIDITRKEMQARKNVLVFTRFIEEARYLVSRIDGAAIVTGETHKKERARVIEGFKRGDIPVVANVGVLTTGFDYPELETVIIARPTMSLALYYQMIGRCTRPHPLKGHARVIDMCGNYESFGKVEDLEIVDGGNGTWFVASGDRQLTNVYYGER